MTVQSAPAAGNLTKGRRGKSHGVLAARCLLSHRAGTAAGRGAKHCTQTALLVRRTRGLDPEHGAAVSPTFTATGRYGEDADLGRIAPTTLAQHLSRGERVVTRDFGLLDPGIVACMYFAPGKIGDPKNRGKFTTSV
jgi:hypothetical protein